MSEVRPNVSLFYMLERAGAVYRSEVSIPDEADWSQLTAAKEACEREMLTAYPDAIFDIEARVIAVHNRIWVVVYATVKRKEG